MNFLMWRAFLQCWVLSKCLAEPRKCVCVFIWGGREREGKIVCVSGWLWQCNSLSVSLSVSKCVFEGVCLSVCSGSVSVRVCFCVSLSVYESLSVWVCEWESTGVYVYAYVYVDVCVSLSGRVCLPLWVCESLCVFVSVCVGLTICVCAVWGWQKISPLIDGAKRVDTHTHTHTHRDKQTHKATSERHTYRGLQTFHQSLTHTLSYRHSLNLTHSIRHSALLKKLTFSSP